MWIPADKELPKNSKWVRAKTKDGTVLERVAFVADRHWIESRIRKLDRERRDITHWMKIEPPKEQK